MKIFLFTTWFFALLTNAIASNNTYEKNLEFLDMPVTEDHKNYKLYKKILESSFKQEGFGEIRSAIKAPSL